MIGEFGNTSVHPDLYAKWPILTFPKTWLIYSALLPAPKTMGPITILAGECLSF